MNSGSTRVESAGPPPVMINGTANTFMATITFITITSSVVGLSSGSVTCQNFAHAPAPSISAAS